MTITVLRGGRIHTAHDPESTALAVTDGIISWIGGEHAVPVAGRADSVIDLRGALVVPGFVDAHVHATDAGLALTGLDLGETRSLTECLARLAAHAVRHPHGVVWGTGWDETRWPEQRAPSRAEIDRCVGDRPAYLARVDVHSALISSALASMVADAHTQPGWAGAGPVSREAHATVRAAARALLGDAQRAAAQRALLAHAAALGIVEVHECAAGDPGGVEDLRALLALDGPVRVRGLLAAAATSAEEARALVAAAGAHALAGDLTVDGAIGSRTAALSEPYHDQPAARGVRYLDDEAIAAHLVACTDAGVQAGFHAIGDAAVSAVAEAVTEAAARLGPQGRARLAGCAHRVEHAEMITPEAIAALAAAGVIASVQPMFDAAWGGADGMYARRLGERAGALNPFAAMAGAGVSLALGSDAPVTGMDPWAAVRAAVHHRTPGAGLSPRAALVGHTRGGHRAAGRTDRGIGTISVGAPADLAVVDAGPLVRPAADARVQRWSTDPRSRVPRLPSLAPGSPLPTTLATVVGGRVVYDAGGLFGGDVTSP